MYNWRVGKKECGTVRFGTAVSNQTHRRPMLNKLTVQSVNDVYGDTLRKIHRFIETGNALC